VSPCLWLLLTDRQAIQTAVQQKEMLIPHIPTEAVTSWTPPGGARELGAQNGSANVFLLSGKSAAASLIIAADTAARRVITKFEIKLMRECLLTSQSLIISGRHPVPQELGTQDDDPDPGAVRAYTACCIPKQPPIRQTSEMKSRSRYL
jgi:hypothetical protein